jgi:hypothetical protein
MSEKITGNVFRTVGILIIALFVVQAVAFASSVDVAVVDVTAPTDSVTLAPGGSADITINMAVTGNQAGTATFKVYRDWTLSGGVFTGANSQEFTVPVRSASDPATTFSTSGTVSIDAGQSADTFTLAVSAFDITNTNTTGAKLEAGLTSNYQVTVVAPVVSDTTPPEITITTPADEAVYLLNQVVLADYECIDESVVVKCDGPVANGDAIDTSTVGAKTFTVDAEDEHDNPSSLTHSYTVVYDFDDFFSPIKMDAFNSVKAGSAVPVKFSLDGDQGLNIFSGTPKIVGVVCSGGSDVSVIADTDTVTAGKSSLQYDADADQYTYVWKTDKSWANKCVELQVNLADGTSYSAFFQFKK